MFWVAISIEKITMENLVVLILQIERQFWVTKEGEMLAIFPTIFWDEFA